MLAVIELLRQFGSADFRVLCASCQQTIEVVARFLALLELYREGRVSFEQPTPLGELTVRWVQPPLGQAAGAAGGGGDGTAAGVPAADGIAAGDGMSAGDESGDESGDEVGDDVPGRTRRRTTRKRGRKKTPMAETTDG
jgi:segregation and condensation protein A